MKILVILDQEEPKFLITEDERFLEFDGVDPQFYSGGSSEDEQRSYNCLNFLYAEGDGTLSHQWLIEHPKDITGVTRLVIIPESW